MVEIKRFKSQLELELSKLGQIKLSEKQYTDL